MFCRVALFLANSLGLAPEVGRSLGRRCCENRAVRGFIFYILVIKRSPFKAWSRSVYSHTCYAYCQGFLPCLFIPFRSIYLHFFQNLSLFLLCWLWLAHGSCVGPQNKIGHSAGCRFPCWAPAECKLAEKTWIVIWCLLKWIIWRWSEVCVQPWCSPLWLTGSKHQLTKLTIVILHTCPTFVFDVCVCTFYVQLWQDWFRRFERICGLATRVQNN